MRTLFSICTLTLGLVKFQEVHTLSFLGTYAILYAQYKPIPDRFEYFLQLASLLMTLANTCIGMMLKVDQNALLDKDRKIMDSMITTVLLVTANVMVIVLVAGELFQMLSNKHSECLSYLNHRKVGS